MCSIYFANSVWASTRSFAQSPDVEPTDRERFYVLDPFWELLRIHRNEEFVTGPYFRPESKIFPKLCKDQPASTTNQEIGEIYEQKSPPVR